MAMFNEILVGRFNKALNDLFGIKAGAPAPSLAGDIGAQIQLDQSGATERRFLEGWDKFAFTSQQAGLAANKTRFKVRNPDGSNVVAVVEKLYWDVTEAAASTVTLAYLNGNVIGTSPDSTNFTNVFGATSAVPFDRRTTRNGTLVFSTVNDATGLPAGYVVIAQHQVIAGVSNYDEFFYEDQTIPMLPGSSLIMEVPAAAGATPFGMIFWWRERPLEDSEKRNLSR